MTFNNLAISIDNQVSENSLTLGEFIEYNKTWAYIVDGSDRNGYQICFYAPNWKMKIQMDDDEKIVEIFHCYKGYPKDNPLQKFTYGRQIPTQTPKEKYGRIPVFEVLQILLKRDNH